MRNEFPGLLRGELQRLGKRPSWLASEVGVSRTAVSDWLAGERFPKPEYLERIASALGRRVSWFYKRAEAA